ncbi:uncharacterized protein LOC129700884 [Leucoraja erinacea]|uniref:uncharacterized protein LOC129700884 n=1 Tax=Leucoraja erinaceus TaxID=7782 RepID=UPI0024539246|nr:uncharacterized protein LOC129700884 [Leucoraja erinacea]
MRPPFQYLAGKPQDLVWTDEAVATFDGAKEALAKATLLVHPQATASTALIVEASDTAVGGVLEQLIDGRWQLLAYFSRHLRPPERSYSAFDLAVWNVRYFLEGMPFTAFTDPKPDICLSQGVPPGLRHLPIVSEFTTDVQHVVGKLNLVADAPSRPALKAVMAGDPGVEYAGLAEAQRAGGEKDNYRMATSGLRLADVPFGSIGESVVCDMSTGRPRPIVPVGFRHHPWPDPPFHPRRLLRWWRRN